MVDNDLIKKYHLEEARKRFNQICEYTFITSPTLSEDDNDEEDVEGQNPNEQPDSQDVEDNQMPDMNNSEPDNSEDMMPTDNTQQGEGDIPTDNNEPQQADVDMDMPEDDDTVETDTLQDDDEVIDVDELTKSQETSEYKIDGVDDKLTKLLSVVNKFTSALEQNDKKIEDLKSEFEKRNPTDEEMLNIRSQSSYPYSVKPKDYWDNKKGDGKYNVFYDNDVAPNDEQEEYKFTKDDLKGIDDRTIAKSLDDDYKLKDILSF